MQFTCQKLVQEFIKKLLLFIWRKNWNNKLLNILTINYSLWKKELHKSKNLWFNRRSEILIPHQTGLFNFFPPHSLSLSPSLYAVTTHEVFTLLPEGVSSSVNVSLHVAFLYRFHPQNFLFLWPSFGAALPLPRRVGFGNCFFLERYGKVFISLSMMDF